MARGRLLRLQPRAGEPDWRPFSSDVDTGSRKNASKQKSWSPVLIQSEPGSRTCTQSVQELRTSRNEARRFCAVIQRTNLF